MAPPQTNKDGSGIGGCLGGAAVLGGCAVVAAGLIVAALAGVGLFVALNPIITTILVLAVAVALYRGWQVKRRQRNRPR